MTDRVDDEAYKFLPPVVRSADLLLLASFPSLLSFHALSVLLILSQLHLDRHAVLIVFAFFLMLLLSSESTERRTSFRTSCRACLRAVFCCECKGSRSRRRRQGTGPAGLCVEEVQRDNVSFIYNA
ncbi:hypothetical protein CEXT_228621 [Caerostris extrusa]|uniref:Uncharacterized protein n=1 Tax=Caerostris extrusa TaxID=172846 RepID=A0AAV4MJ75_CAEEX|nr:hypothetical protein CEXT_228621 [Caerostris extrusa]